MRCLNIHEKHFSLILDGLTLNDDKLILCLWKNGFPFLKRAIQAEQGEKEEQPAQGHLTDDEMIFSATTQFINYSILCTGSENTKFMLDVMPHKAPSRLRVYHANQCIANADAPFNMDCTEHGKKRGRKDTTLSEAINFNRKPTSANINYEFAMEKTKRRKFFRFTPSPPFSDVKKYERTHKTFIFMCSFLSLIETERNFAQSSF